MEYILFQLSSQVSNHLTEVVQLPFLPATVCSDSSGKQFQFLFLCRKFLAHFGNEQSLENLLSIPHCTCYICLTSCNRNIVIYKTTTHVLPCRLAYLFCNYSFQQLLSVSSVYNQPILFHSLLSAIFRAHMFLAQLAVKKQATSSGCSCCFYRVKHQITLSN